MSGVFPGCSIYGSDLRYPTMVRGFNPRWIGKPEFVQVCGDTDQVVNTVQAAHGEGKRITARSGGHCYENFVCEGEGGVIVDLSPMSGVYQEPSNPGLYCVEGGATLWNVYNELYRQFGLTIPGGSCYSVGVGGHVTGGGYGLLSRLYGLTVDYLQAVEVVRVDSGGTAEAIVADRDSSDEELREILWGHQGGGGGNFGIVTKFWFAEPPPAPEQVTLLNVAWDWGEFKSEEDFAGLIRAYGEALAENSEPGSPLSKLFTLLHLTQYAGDESQIVLTMQFAGGESAPLEQFARRVGSGLPSPSVQRAPVGYHSIAADTVETRQLPWLFATQALNGETPNLRGKYKSAYMLEEFPASQVATMWKYLREKPNVCAKQALLQVDSYGCQVNAVAPDATAVAQRSSIMKLQYQTYWTEESLDDENLAWIRDFYEEMYPGQGEPLPDGLMDGCFVNYPDVDLENWQQLYYKDNYPRLQRAKALCDPLDVFHHAQSIELPPPGS